MNILLIHQAFASPREAGGTRHYELASYMVERGNNFTIVASNLSLFTGKQAVARKGFEVKEDLNGINIFRAYTYPSLHRNYVWRVISFFSFMFTSLIVTLRHANKVDLIMGTTPPIFQAGSAWLAARLRRRPFLLEIRDLWPEFAIDIGVLTNPILIRLSRWFERFLYNHATHILINSPAYRDYLIEKGVPPAKITLIPNGVNANMFNPNDKGKKIREMFGLNGKFVITYAGALGLANDIDIILRAADFLRHKNDIHFLLVGDGKERRRLEAMAKELNLNNLTFTGFFPKSEIRHVLAASDACLATLKDIPMFRTTYPNKVFDYMAAGRPVVLCIDGIIRQVVEEAKAGIFVPPGDDVALAEVLQILYQDPDQGRSMGMAGRHYVIEFFNRQRQAEDFMRLIRKLTNSSKNN